MDLGQSSALQRRVFLHSSKRNRRYRIETNRSLPAHGGRVTDQTDIRQSFLLTSSHTSSCGVGSVRGDLFGLEGVLVLCLCSAGSIRIPQARSSESATRTYLPQLFPPSPSASVGFSATDQQQDNLANRIRRKPLHRRVSLHDFAFAGHCSRFCRSGGKSHASLIHQRMLARKHVQKLETQKQPRQYNRSNRGV